MNRHTGDTLGYVNLCILVITGCDELLLVYEVLDSIKLEFEFFIKGETCEPKTALRYHMYDYRTLHLQHAEDCLPLSMLYYP